MTYEQANYDAWKLSAGPDREDSEICGICHGEDCDFDYKDMLLCEDCWIASQ